MRARLVCRADRGGGARGGRGLAGAPARSLLFALGAAAAAAACAEPAIEMRLELPPPAAAELFDVSCVGAIEVFVRGTDRGNPSTGPSDPGRPADDEYECLEVASAGSYAELKRAIAGRFELSLPGSGLAGVDIRGSTGTCKKDVSGGDTIFYGGARYEGGDELVLPMTPNQSCNAKRMESIRPVDLLALTRAGTCPAPLPNDFGGVDSATIHPIALSPAIFDPNNDLAPMVGNVATLPLYLNAGEDSCIALAYGDDTGNTTTASCVRRSSGVCGSPGQIELPFIDGNVAFQAAKPELIDEHGGWVIGGIWGTDAGGTKVKLTGATVRPAKPADASRVKVVYANYPMGAASPTEAAGATSTTGSGLFIAYVGRPTDFIVSAPGHRDETIRMGSPNEPSTALIFLSKL